MSFTWNHRVIKSGDGYEFSEVYYRDSDKQPYAHCTPHIYGETVEELREVAELLIAATSKPVLDPDEWIELGVLSEAEIKDLDVTLKSAANILKKLPLP